MSRLILEKITKTFPGVRALSSVRLEVEAGEIHALCGENGAGKSTLMNILAGNFPPDEGSITLDGELLHFRRPQEAFEKGIAVVYQHLSLVDSLSVAENIFANQHPHNRWGFIDYSALHKKTQELLDQLHIQVRGDQAVSRLSPSMKQMVEIAKALARKPRILVLDEPTASLTDKETATLYKILQRLKEAGTSIIYISHRLAEIFALADRVTVLKDGTWQGTWRASEMTPESLIRTMVGRDIKTIQRKALKSSDVLLNVKNLSGARFRNVSFKLHRGEILGLSGLAGAGRTEIARGIFGADRTTGEVEISGVRLNTGHPADAIGAGIAYVPEERKTLGLFSGMSITENIIAAYLNQQKKNRLFNAGKNRSIASEYREKLRIVSPDVAQKVVNLSGGNQQKVVLGKWLLTGPDVLIVDEPTHGVDIGAKYEIYELLRELAGQGKGILLISSELPELLALCDRIVVIRQGEVSGELSGEEASEEKILNLAT